MFNYILPNKIFLLIEKIIKFINSIFFVVLIIGLTFSLVISPPDYIQGDSVRIMYVHVPSSIISLGYFNSGLWNELSKNKKEQLLDKTLIKKTGDFNSIYETINLIIKYDTINMSTIYLDGGNLNRSKI